MTTLIGTSGWTYASWDGVFYPPDLNPRLRLEHYSQHFPTVELNASYYRWPRDASFTGWHRRLPEGFVLTVKAPRPLTHGARLHEPEKWTGIIARGLELLGERRGPLLVQLPPSMERDDARLDYFLGQIPEWIRVAVEFRHGSWVHDDVFALLERHGASYVVMSGAQLACVLRATAPLVYVRWHSPDDAALYGGSYPDEDLRWWADRIREWEGQGRDVLGYFNNDMNGYAVANASRLRELLA